MAFQGNVKSKTNLLLQEENGYVKHDVLENTVSVQIVEECVDFFSFFK